ncbi:protein FAM71F2-like, partial [Python bivittatus]|uniref:Protein FAM71F2-like n=1 Tax=Python bivittatus TaxID=176946 RepID=A0A9F3QUP4_PYTBI
ISKQGGPIEIHNQEQIVTVGITSTNPVLLIPNVLLLARPIVPSEEHISKFRAIFHHQPPVRFELTRLFPLRFVKISIHNSEKKQLRLKLVSGRTYYLQLCPQSNRREDLFDAWVRIVQLLRPSSEISVKEQNQKNKKLKSHGVPLVPPLKLKEPQIERPVMSPPPQRESQRTPEKKTKKKNKSKKSICPATQNSSADETKKNSDPAAVLSESSPIPEIEPQPLNTENIHEALCHPTPEDQDIAKKLEEEEEKEETKSPSHKSHAGEKGSSDIK